MSEFNAKKARTKHALPMWVDSFLRDTMTLSVDQIGAYNLILYAMWSRQSCDLPQDDAQFAAVCRVTKTIWLRKVKPVIWPLLEVSEGVVFSKRLKKEAVFVEKYLKSQSDKKRGKSHVKPLETNDLPQSDDISTDVSGEDPTQQPNNPTYIGGGGSAGVREKNSPPAELPTFREKLLAASGADPVSGLTGHGGAQLGTGAQMIEAERWKTDLGLSEAEIETEVARLIARKRDGPPSSLNFFTKPMERLAGQIAEARSKPMSATQPKGSRHDQRFGDQVHGLAKGLSDGSVQLDTRSRDPFAS